MFVYNRPLNINTIYLSQKYTNVPCTIRENSNIFVFFKQSIRAIKDFIYKDISDQFENDIEIKNFYKINIKDKHDFLLYNQDEGKWYDKSLQHIHKGIKFLELYEDEGSYAEAKIKAFKANQENRKIINYREHLNAALYESTSVIFEPLTKKNYLLKYKKEIVKQLRM